MEIIQKLIKITQKIIKNNSENNKNISDITPINNDNINTKQYKNDIIKENNNPDTRVNNKKDNNINIISNNNGDSAISTQLMVMKKIIFQKMAKKILIKN